MLKHRTISLGPVAVMDSEGNIKMKKFWIVYATKNSGTFLHFYTKNEAVDEAKRRQALEHNNQFIVLESVLITVQPVPQIEMREL